MLHIATETFFNHFLFSALLASGSENDLNYFELPMDVNVETSLNEIDGQHPGDETVRIYEINDLKLTNITEYHYNRRIVCK